MIARVLSLVILVPLAILLVVFCVANRAPVAVSLDPLGTMPQLDFAIPLFVLLMACVIFGVVLGGIGTWATQAHYRRKAARRQREIDRLTREAEDARAELRLVTEAQNRALAAPPRAA